MIDETWFSRQTSDLRAALGIESLGAGVEEDFPRKGIGDLDAELEEAVRHREEEERLRKRFDESKREWEEKPESTSRPSARKMSPTSSPR
ncbi:MAG: hypothetical protein U0231_16440 [Nitrospiraceae bacterium]